jgi:hypothetical protein
MNFYRSLVLFALTVACIGNSKAAEEFQDFIPIEVAEALFGFGIGGEMQVYSDIMDEFPEFQLPAQFEVLGSTSRSTSLTVAMATALDESQARAAITESFADQGWIEMPVFSPSPRVYGFVSPNRPPTPSYRQLCHDEHGQINVSYRAGPRNILSLHAGNAFGADYRTCAERIEQQELSMVRMSRGGRGMYDSMPLLLVPEEARQGNMPFIRGGGGSSSGNKAETDTSFALDWDLEEVYEHFSDQMDEQGWTLDAESIGSVTATGTWTQPTTTGGSLVARLDVVNSRDDQFDLTLSVERPGGRRSGVFFGN